MKLRTLKERSVTQASSATSAEANGSGPATKATGTKHSTVRDVGSSAPSATATTGLTHGVYNDSSFASVETSDRNRHIFFQDLDGTLQHYQCDADSSCSINLGEMNVNDARNSTPMGAVTGDSGEASL